MLTPDERAILQFEEAHPVAYAGKENDIRVQLGISIVRYQQKLLTLCTRQDAVAAYPQVANLMLRRQEHAIAKRDARLLKRFEDSAHDPAYGV